MSVAGRHSTLIILAVIALGNASIGNAAATCTADEFVAGIANVTDLHVSAGLLNGTLPIVGTPSNSTVFLPTDAAWSAFRSANGASAPDTNRSVAILLYNSIITLGQASEAALVQSSPVQTSAAELLSFVVNRTAYLPIAFANVSSVIQATDVAGNTVNLTAFMTLCNTQVYSTSGVLLPAASYGAVPETYVADTAALRRLATPSPPSSASTGAGPPPSATPTPVATPTAAPSAGAAASSPASASPVPSPTTSSAAAPAPAPSAAVPGQSGHACLLVVSAGSVVVAFLAAL